VRHKEKLRDVVRKSFRRLSRKYELVVIEGAGSPAEINLKSHDIVNMQMARYAAAPVILVGDIDKGGVFAWLIGTLALLSAKERKMVKGFIINKFRGDKRLLKGGIDFIERRTGIKVLGVVPYFRDIRISEEDSVCLDSRVDKNVKRRDSLTVNIIYLPHISNFTDFDALEREQDVKLRYIRSPQEISHPDVIIIPGTKNTIGDLQYLRRTGLAQRIKSVFNSRKLTVLIGICGGYQMLGVKICDKYSLESNAGEVDGLGVLPVKTYLEREKTLTRVQARELSSGFKVSGYEIHHGRTSFLHPCPAGRDAYGGKGKPAFEIFERNGEKVRCFDGMMSPDSRVLGTYIHGLFDNDNFRRSWLNRIRQRKGLSALAEGASFSPDREFDKLAQLLRENINIDKVYEILRINNTYASQVQVG
jgi:adenosylcobyric acid synthase